VNSTKETCQSTTRRTKAKAAKGQRIKTDSPRRGIVGIKTARVGGAEEGIFCQENGGGGDGEVVGEVAKIYRSGNVQNPLGTGRHG